MIRLKEINDAYDGQYRLVYSAEHRSFFIGVGHSDGRFTNSIISWERNNEEGDCKYPINIITDVNDSEIGTYDDDECYSLSEEELAEHVIWEVI